MLDISMERGSESLRVNSSRKKNTAPKKGENKEPQPQPSKPHSLLLRNWFKITSVSQKQSQK